MTEKRSRTFWEMGIRLNEAWLHFASPAVRASYKSLPTGMETFTAQASASGNEGGLDELFSAINTGLIARQERENSEATLKSELLDRAFNGDFELLGFRIEPTKSRTPVIVAAMELDTYEPNWSAETIQIRDELYIHLRVSPARKPTGKKRGRPGSTDLIRREIAELISDRSNCFCDLLRKTAVDMVIQSLNAKGYDTGKVGTGLSNQNVTKLIVEQCAKRKIK